MPDDTGDIRVTRGNWHNVCLSPAVSAIGFREPRA